MKYELTEKETLAMLRIVERIVGIAERMAEARSSTKVADAIHTALAHMVARDARDAADDAEGDDIEVEADDADEDDEDDEEPAPAQNVTPFPAAPSPVAEVPPAEPTAAEREAEEKRVKVLHGKDQWIALIEVWRQGFMVPDAPQPDRVANLNAAINPFVMTYLAQRDGLTHATREAIYLLDGGDPEAPTMPLTNGQLREARLIAENIAQVASFHAPFLAEQLEYAHKYHTIPKEP